jgi:N-acetyl-alpha-D-muramate 1-phosphate uridylyltransferase
MPDSTLHQPTLHRAILLAAGRGERMRPLTDKTPKPLLQVQGLPLMQWHLQALAAQGFADVLVNTAWLGEQIEARFGASLHYSHEGRDFGGALETAGGIARALPALDAVFWVLAGDVYTPGFVFSAEHFERFAVGTRLAHIWLVPNPPHNPGGDFGLDAATGLALNLPKDSTLPRYTYSTIGLYRKALFQPPYCSIAPGNPQGAKAALAPLLRAAMDAGQVSAEIYTGPWTDVGTPERLAQLNHTTSN